MGQPSIMRYTIGGTTEYRRFIEDLRKKLAKSKDGSIDEIKVGELSAAVLPKLRELNTKQDQLLHIELHAKKQNSNESWTTTLAMRKDNLYIVGFTGKDGKWFELAESGCPLPEEYHSTQLYWNVRYKSIMNLKDNNQVKRTLRKTRLGMAFAIRAVRRLVQYPDLDYEDDKNPTGLGLAGLIVLICESARMETIRKEIHNGWGRKGVLVKEEVLDYIWGWGPMSAALMRWRKYKEEYTGDSHLLGVMHEAGLRLVHNSENVEGGARVEIFAVSANFHVTSITVTDVNTRGRTIYNNHEVTQMEQEQGMVDLELNVLPKGISGYKWFDFVIKSQGAATEPVIVTWRLDCRKQDGNATEVVNRKIAFDSQRKMDVTYLVMSDTVKAKVEVRLGDKYWPIPADIQVFHGEIVACIDGFDHRIVLLRINDKSGAKAVKPWHTFPLDRSDVWVPRGSKRVRIEMKHLHVTVGDNEISIPDSLSFVFNLGDLRPSSGDDDSTVYVNIAWDGTPQKEVINIQEMGKDE